MIPTGSVSTASSPSVFGIAIVGIAAACVAIAIGMMKAPAMRPERLWLVLDAGPVAAEVRVPHNPVGICEAEPDARAIVAWRFAVEQRLTELMVLPVVPEFETPEARDD